MTRWNYTELRARWLSQRFSVMITSFIIHHLGWQASNMFWGHLSEMLYRASEATSFANTCRLLVTYRMSRSGLLPICRRCSQNLWTHCRGAGIPSGQQSNKLNDIDDDEGDVVVLRGGI